MKTQAEILKDLLSKKQDEKYLNNYIAENFKFNAIINMSLKSFSYTVDNVRITVVYFPIPDKLDNELREIYHYIILYPISFYKNGEFHGNEEELLRYFLQIIDNDIFTLNLVKSNIKPQTAKIYDN